MSEKLNKQEIIEETIIDARRIIAVATQKVMEEDDVNAKILSGIASIISAMKSLIEYDTKTNQKDEIKDGEQLPIKNKKELLKLLNENLKQDEK